MIQLYIPMVQKNGYFHSQTYGLCTPEKMRRAVLGYLKADHDHSYRLVIGTDSQAKNGTSTDFVVALIIHRIGAGGIYFWKRIEETRRYLLRQRMFQEAIFSLAAAEEFLRSEEHT